MKYTRESLEDAIYSIVKNESGFIIEGRVAGTIKSRQIYNKQSRIIREDIEYMDITHVFEYNENNQITKKTTYHYTLSPTLANPIRENRYTYSDTKLSLYDDESIVYDKDNNPVVYRDEEFNWSSKKQLLSIGKVSKYQYNEHGLRISKCSSDGSMTRFYLNGDKVIAQEDEEKLYFLYDNNSLKGFTAEFNNKIVQEYTYSTNKYGDIVGIINDKNLMICKYVYDKNLMICKYVYDTWGNHEIFIYDGNKYINIRDTDSYTDICMLHSYIAKLNPFRFHSYYFDDETGLYYAKSKYYDPEIGKILNA